MSHLSEPSVALLCLQQAGADVDAIRPFIAGLPDHADAADFALDWRGDTLTLFDRNQPRNQPLFVDWVTPLRAMRSYPASRKDPMGRALGRKTGSIIDATAGWGQDALRMVMMGYRVHMLERSPVIAALLSDGLRRLGEQTQLVSRLQAMPTLTWCDSAEALLDMEADCTYLDPMFGPRPKPSVLSKRPLLVLRAFAGDAIPDDRLFEAASRGSRRRIVVKRPDHIKQPSPPPDETFAGKLVRYDVYLQTGPAS